MGSSVSDLIQKIIIFVLIIICIALFSYSQCTRKENNNYKNNIEVLQDSVEIYKMKTGELLYSKQALFVENQELTESLNISKKKQKELEKELKSKIELLSKMEGKLIIDTLILNDTIYKIDSITYLDFNFNDDYLTLEGRSILNEGNVSTKINHLSTDVSLTFGITKKGKIFIECPNPYINITNIEASRSITKPKRWNVGAQVGFGIGYNLLDKNLTLGPYIGVGVSYGFNF